MVCGLHIRAGVEDDAKMIFEDNTITGVQIALKRETGNLDLDSVLAKNNFDAGSRVVENIIYIPLESSIYNITKDKYYDTIQEAVYAADEGDIIQVGPGIYHGYLTINKPLTLIGPNVGVPGAVLPGYYDERGPEAVITVPKEVDLENPEYAEMKAVINIESPGVTIDGFRITGDNGNGKKNYAGCNIQAAYGIYASDGEFELDNLVLRNNVFDCFSGMGICIIDFDDYTPNENISISRNLFRNIHDLRLEGPGQGILMLGATGSVTENVVGNSRLGIMVIPLDATGVGLVKDNYFETYVTGIIYKDAETGAGTWTFEENTVTAVDPPDNFEREARWRGITLQYISMGAGPVKFINNTVDGSGTSAEHNKRSKIIGLHIEEGVESDVEIIFKGNTVTGVQIGLIWDSGNLDLKDILVNNTFDHGSIIIDNTIRLPEENTVYNLETYEQYASIQEAVYEAKPGTTIVVGPGTYREDLVIPEGKDKLTLKGMNAGIPVGVWPTLWLGDRVPESIIVGSITVGSEGGQNGGTVEGLSIDGFTIDTRGEYGIALSATGETTIANNIIKGNGRAKHGIKVENVGTAHLIISCNTIEYYGTDEDSAGILIRGSNATAQITENLIDGAASYRDTYATGIEITEGAKANIVENWIQGNRFGLVLDSNDNIVSSNFIENNYWGIYMSKSGNSVTDNVIIENYIGVVADEGSDNTVTFNWIYDNDELGARTDLEGTHLTATHNWWGVSTADEVMEQISGNVEFSPWYIDEEMTVLSDEAAVEAVNSAFDEEELPTQLDRVFDEEALP